MKNLELKIRKEKRKVRRLKKKRTVLEILLLISFPNLLDTFIIIILSYELTDTLKSLQSHLQVHFWIVCEHFYYISIIHIYLHLLQYVNIYF